MLAHVVVYQRVRLSKSTQGLTCLLSATCTTVVRLVSAIELRNLFICNTLEGVA
jgi:hypothetical protein